MPLTTAQAALQVSGAKAISLILVRPRDPANSDAVVEVGIASGNFITEPGDTPPSFPFDGLLAEGSGVRFSEHLINSGAHSPGSAGGGSEIGRGDLEIEARDEQASWRDLDWNGAEFTAYVGARHRADGQRMVFSEFDAPFTGVVERMDALGDRRWRMSFADPRAELEEPATVKFYRGFGGAFLLPAGESLSGDGNASITIEPPFQLALVGKLLATPASLDGNLIRIQWGTGVGDRSAAIKWTSGGELRVAIDTGSGVVNFDSGHMVADGETFYGVLVVEADGVTVRLYAGEDADDVLEVDTITLGTALTSGAWNDFEIGGASGPRFEAWEAQLWSVANTQEELEDLGDGPVTDATDQADLIESWRFAEGAEIGTGPEVVFGEKGVLDLIYSGSTPTWVSSYEGDDPDLFPGSPAGLTKDRSWGPTKNVKLTLVDSQRPAFTWNDAVGGGGSGQVVHRLRTSGVPMVREHSVAASVTDPFVFDAATNTVTYGNLTLDLFSFQLFIPGQQEPARLGQRVKISGTANNNGVARVGVDGITLGGRKMEVADKTLVNESSSTAVIESYAPDVQFEAFEFVVPRRVELPSVPGGDLTTDLITTVTTSAKWGSIHAAISGKTVNKTAVTFEPFLEYHLPAGDAKTKKAVLDELARAAFGWWVENASGGHDLGTWLPPSGSPVASVGKPQLSGVEPLATVLPRGKYEIAHSPIWHVQDGDALAGSVSAGDRKRWSEPFTIRPVVDRRVRDVRFPLSSEIPRLTTFLSAASAITTFEGLASPFHFREARWFRLVFDSLWPLFIRRNECITVTWDDPDLELDGTLCRVTGREVDLARGRMELEVFFLKPEPA